MQENNNRINDKVYNLLKDKLNLHQGYNVEISYIWYQICLDLKQEDSIEYVKRFLLCNGRMRYINPLYTRFYQFKREEALKFFKENK